MNENIALFPPVVLDNLIVSSYWKSVNKVRKRYTSLEVEGYNIARRPFFLNRTIA